MTEKTIWVKGFVPRLKRRVGHPYAVVDLAVAVECAEAEDLELFAEVQIAGAGYPPGHLETVPVVSYNGRFWRPIQVSLGYGEEMPDGEKALARSGSDSPIMFASESFKKQTVDPHAPEAAAEHADPDAVRIMSARIAEAASGCLLAGGRAWRACHEPTWIVARARHGAEGVLVQPFLAEPRLAGNGAWFSWDTKELAENFAAEMAQENGLNVIVRGEIEVSAPIRPSFDAVRHSEDRLLHVCTVGLRPLLGTLPEKAEQHAGEVRAALRAGDRASAVEAAFALLDAVPDEQKPDVEAFLEAAAASSYQAAYFRSNGILSTEDEEALSSLSFGPR